MNHAEFQGFIGLISGRTGLHLRDEDRNKFEQTVRSRMAVHGFSSDRAYFALLASRAGAGEWDKLVSILTVGESYFFRDCGQMDLLKSRILPELIDRRRQARRLRIWSAGCATGEEPYSLAILLHELLPFRGGWDPLVVGTDIDRYMIERASRAVYGKWSFRGVPAGIRDRYFQQERDRWQVREDIRSMVTFYTGNLFEGDFPDAASDMCDMDLIVCRNVFIYFAPAAVAAVVEKFARTLAAGGYLLTGHNELYGQKLGLLQSRQMPGSVIYQRPTEAPDKPPAARPQVPPAVSRPARRIPAAPPPVRSAAVPGAGANGNLEARAEAALRRGDYVAAIEKASALLAEEPEHFGALRLSAQAYANAGDYDQALRICRQALSVDPFSPASYHLMAQIAEERGDAEAARAFLKKVLYLDPSNIAAYVELSVLYGREGDAKRAETMRAAALDLLSALPDDAPVHPYDHPAGELRRHLETMA